MKRLNIVFIALLCFNLSYAQIQPGFNYQTVARSLNGSVLSNAEISLKISILQGTTSGNSVCTEVFKATTSTIGLINVVVGSQDKAFEQIDWSKGPYFLKIELDEKGGSNFSFIGTSQLLSVPYAFHSKTSGSATETDPLFSVWDKSSGISIKENQIIDLKHFKNTDETDPIFSGSVAAKITNTDIASWSNKTEIDPIFSNSAAKNITLNDITVWNAKGSFDGKYTNLTNLPNFHKVAFSGDYNDLINAPQNTISLNQTPIKGDILYYNGTQWTRLPIGTEGQILTINLAGLPVWK